MATICLKAGENYGTLGKKAETGLAWFSLTHYGPQDTYGKHYHDHAYLSLLTNGAYTERNKKDTLLLEKGQLIYRPAAYDHANGFTGKPGTCFNIVFKTDWRQFSGLKLNLPVHHEIYRCGTFPVVYKTLSAFQQNRFEALPELLLHWLIEVNDTKFRETDLRWVNKVKNILETEFETHHTIESLSKRVFVHPVYLAHYFKTKTGFTVGDYQQKKRLQKAAALLMNSSESITEIALAAGFFDAAHFIRNFTKAYGTSPAKFRKQMI